MLTTMASRAEFKYDAIVLHDEDEFPEAREFCTRVKASVKSDRPLLITTFEEYSHLGKTDVQNLEDAIKDARFIFCSEYHYHTNPFGTFSGQVALPEKIPDKFILIRTGRAEGETATMRAYKGMKLDENWEVPEYVLEKLRGLFSDTLDETKDQSADRDSGQNTAMSELSAAEYCDPWESLSELSSASFLDVENPSLSTAGYRSVESATNKNEAEHRRAEVSTSECHHPQESVCELSESFLDVENPSLLTVGYRSGESAINSNEAEHRQASTPRPQKATPLAQTSKPGGLERRGPLTTTTGSTILPGDDLEEDSEQGVDIGTNTVPEASGKAQAAASHSSSLVKRKTVSKSEQSADPAPRPHPTDAEKDRPDRGVICGVLCIGIILFFVMYRTGLYFLQSDTSGIVSGDREK